MNLSTNPSATFGSLMTVFLTPAPGLSIVEAAGTQIPAGSGPAQILLPIGAPSLQDVTVRATNLTGLVPVRLVLTPDVGDRVVVDGVIDAGNGPEGEETFTVAFPANTVTHVYAFTR